MKNISIFNVILFSFVLSIFLFPKNFASVQPDTLAIVNGKPVTSGDFKNRFELSVYPGKGLNGNLYKTKRGFLYSMIAERLLSGEALKALPNDNKNEEFLKNETERMFLRDALYRREILPKSCRIGKRNRKGRKIFNIFLYTGCFLFSRYYCGEYFL